MKRSLPSRQVPIPSRSHCVRVPSVRASSPMFVLASAFLLAGSAARADDDPKAVLTVKVEHIAPRGGNLRLALYDQKSFAEDDAPAIADRVVSATPPVQM